MQDWAKQELLLFIHLNMAVLCLAGLTADRLGLGPGFEDLAQWARNWQACHTDPIWKDTMGTTQSAHKKHRVQRRCPLHSGKRSNRANGLTWLTPLDTPWCITRFYRSYFVMKCFNDFFHFLMCSLSLIYLLLWKISQRGHAPYNYLTIHRKQAQTCCFWSEVRLEAG